MIGRRSNKHRPDAGEHFESPDDADRAQPEVGGGGGDPMHSGDCPADQMGDAESAIIADLEAQLVELRAECEQLKHNWMQEAAELRNFRRRAAEAEAEARRQSLSGVVRNLVPLIDHMEMGIDQASSAQNVEQVIGGVRSIRDEFVRVLESFGVTMIRPNPGDEPDPQRHQVLTFQPSNEVQPGRISAVFRPGYAIGDRVIRPAEVIVAAEPSS